MMDRRKVWVFLLVCSIPAQTGTISSARAQTGELKEGRVYFQAFRQRVPLNSGWRFKRQSAPGAATEPEFVGAENPSFDDSLWSRLWLPHTWDATADNPFATAGHFRGIGWYRREFDAPPDWQGRRVHIEFKGVFQTADVWVNGRSAGQHTGGYTGFTLDVTDLVRWGPKNLLAVRVNDVLDPNIAPAHESNVAVYGGIYRSVALVITSLTHFPSNGIAVTTEVGAGGGSVVRVKTRIENPSSSPHSGRLETLVVDVAGQPVAKLNESFNAPAGKITEVSQDTPPILNPHLWSPDDPYLYSVISTIYEGERGVDRVTTPFGIRFMGYDPKTGFTLNGQPINLHGVNRRQDYGFLGDAVPEAVGGRDIRLIKEMGANFLRTSHYPQDPAVLDECDRVGILVWEEIPNIKIYMYPPTIEDTEAHHTERFPRGLVENLKQQLREMIERDRNHPSIIIWGLADDLSTYHYPEDFVELSNAAHALDRTRWTAGRAPHVTDIIDATSEAGLTGLHAEHPERMYFWNEWGPFPAERGREGDPMLKHTPADPGVTPMGDSNAALLLEGYLMQWNALPWLGTAKWGMFDAGEPNAVFTHILWQKPDGEVMFRWPFNDYMGAADMWRIPKNEYYFLQSQWTEKPMVHIVGSWSQAQHGAKMRPVRVYSNCDTVELFLNGRSLGVHQPATKERIWQDFRREIGRYKSPDEFNQQPLPRAALPHPPFVWDDVTFEVGTLVAVGRRGAVSVRHELRTAGTAARIALRSEKPALAADGADVSFIEADVVDAAGVTVPAARPWIRFSIEGPGRLVGGTVEVDAISGVAAINAQSTGEPGEIVVSATSPGLQPGLVRLTAK